jgi:hypothetical protein
MENPACHRRTADVAFNAEDDGYQPRGIKQYRRLGTDVYSVGCVGESLEPAPAPMISLSSERADVHWRDALVPSPRSEVLSAGSSDKTSSAAAASLRSPVEVASSEDDDDRVVASSRRLYETTVGKQDGLWRRTHALATFVAVSMLVS